MTTAPIRARRAPSSWPGRARLEFVTPERIVLPEIGGTNYPAYLKAFGEHGVSITLNRRLRAIRRAGNRLAAIL